MSDQQPDPDPSWQWDNSQWRDTPAAPRTPDEVPEPGDDRDGWTAGLRRLLRWARH